MDTISLVLTIGLTAVATVALVLAFAWWYARRMLRKLGGPPTPVVRPEELAHGRRMGLTVVEPEPEPEPTRSCESCKHWSLEAGQHEMRRNPAFHQATAHLAPWQMGRPRKVKSNPEYDAVEKKLEAAIQARDYELQKKLHNELMELRPGELIPPEEYVAPEVLALTWQDLGACAKHRELRMRTDACEAYEVKLQAVAS